VSPLSHPEYHRAVANKFHIQTGPVLAFYSILTSDLSADIYVDGVEVSTTLTVDFDVPPLGLDVNTLYVGAKNRDSGVSGYLDAKVDEISIWVVDSELDAAQRVEFLYGNSNGRIYRPWSYNRTVIDQHGEDLVALWKFEEQKASDIKIDYVGGTDLYNGGGDTVDLAEGKEL